MKAYTVFLWLPYVCGTGRVFLVCVVVHYYIIVE